MTAPEPGENARHRAETLGPATTGPRLGVGWYLGLAASVAWLIAAHSMTIACVKYANVDEAYASALGERLIEGYRLYEGAVSQRGPLMYYTYAAIGLALGWSNILGLRLVALGFELILLALVYWFGRRAIGPRAGILATIGCSYALVFGVPPDDGLALNGETILLPLAVLGAALGAAGVQSYGKAATARRYLFASGLALGAAACVKQSALLHPAAVLAWLLAWSVRRPLRDVAIDVLLFLAGVFALPLAFAAHAAWSGTLPRLVYYCFYYNRVVHLHPLGARTPRFFVFEHIQEYPWFATCIGSCLAVDLAALYGNFVQAPRRLRTLLESFGVGAYLWAHFLCAFLTAAALPQLFAHYYLVGVPFLSLIAAARIEQSLLQTGAAAAVRVAIAGACAVWTVAAGGLVYLRLKNAGRVTHDSSVELAAAYVASRTQASDKIFVWGFSPWLYGYANRRPAGRFVFETYVTGFVPWFWEALDLEPGRVVPGAMGELLGDLDRELPAVVVDAGSVVMGRPMRAYAPMAGWVHANYCFDARIGAVDIYVRRHGNACAQRCMPWPAPNVDYFGRPLPVLMPPIVDTADTRPLPPGSFFDPIRYSDPWCIPPS